MGTHMCEETKPGSEAEMRAGRALGSMERSLEFTLMWREASEWLQGGEYHELIYV